MRPLVSVVLPTYNRRTSILNALQSVFEQDYRPIEIIVVDDGSSDDTAEWLRASSYPLPVTVIALPINQGPAAARNAGLERASGAYVAFLDSDDSWLPEKLSRQVELLEVADTSTVVFCQAYIQRKYDTVIRPTHSQRTGETLGEYLFSHGGYIAICSILMSTSLARGVRFRPNQRLHEDWDFFLRLEAAGVLFVMCGQPLCVVDDRDPSGRASAPDPEISLTWLDTWKEQLAPTAYLGLRAKIAPQLRYNRPGLAVRYIYEAWTKRAISCWTLMILVGRLVHPAVREAAYWIHGRTTGRKVSGDVECRYRRSASASQND